MRISWWLLYMTGYGRFTLTLRPTLSNLSCSQRSKRLTFYCLFCFTNPTDWLDKLKLFLPNLNEIQNYLKFIQVWFLALYVPIWTFLFRFKFYLFQYFLLPSLQTTRDLLFYNKNLILIKFLLKKNIVSSSVFDFSVSRHNWQISRFIFDCLQVKHMETFKRYQTT